MATRKTNFYGSQGGREINLRTEFNRTMYGHGKEIAKAQTALMRVFRRDANDKLIPCSCVSSITNEPDKERRCTVCLAEGFTWDEITVDLYHAEVNTESQRSTREELKLAGNMNTPLRVFYIPVSYTLTAADKLVLLKLDKEGKVILPMQRKEIYKLAAVNDMRLDEGKLEFWKANGYLEINKHL